MFVFFVDIHIINEEMNDLDSDDLNCFPGTLSNKEK